MENWKKCNKYAWKAERKETESHIIQRWEWQIRVKYSQEENGLSFQVNGLPELMSCCSVKQKKNQQTNFDP